MAIFNSFLRRASSSLLHPDCAFLNVQNRHLIGSQFLQFSQFSTATGEIIESDNSAHQQLSDVQQYKLPFQIHDGYEKGTVYLKRQFGDESVKVVVKFDPNKIGDDTKQELQLYVEIYRGNDCVDFEIDALPDDQMAVRKMSMSGNMEALKNLWETRGLNPTTRKTLCDYLKNKRIRAAS